MSVPEHTVHYLEIVTQDAQEARRHYEEAYGWLFQAMGPAWGDSFVADLPDGSRCGIRSPMSDEEKVGVRTYLRVPDIHDAVKKVVELGATIALEPAEMPGHGLLAIYVHGGIEQGIWQLP